ncbi:twin-arginine translocation pathway signal [Rhodococcus zopfii]|uniref:twin-arginine translocation pathway signal n=1 Tax=Rhodococcus zopfii TaxID=43772 RepID=UPI0009F82F21|nr:twin-arginine translocation pathway signal [Rhodococcus zopfii]
MSDENRTEKNDGKDETVVLEKSSETLDEGNELDTASDTSADDAVPPADDAVTATGTGGVPRALAGALVAVAVVLAAVVGWLAYGKSQDNAAEAARTDAVQAAEEQAVAVLAYSYDKVDEQVAAAAEGLTGDFREEYLNLMNNVIAPGAKEKSISVQAVVQSSSIVSAEADHAVTMLFVNTISTNSEYPEAVSSASRVRVELENENGRWLVSRLAPI